MIAAVSDVKEVWTGTVLVLFFLSSNHPSHAWFACPDDVQAVLLITRMQ